MAGVVVLLFAAYQEWGTSFSERPAQARLRAEFAAAVAAPTTPTTAVVPTAIAAPTTTVAPPVAAPAAGQPVAVLRIPRLGLDKVVVEGVGTAELKQGPGHYPTTPLPGRTGNVAIAGHRTTYGAPFYSINELQPGDEILLSTLAGDARYVVTGSRVVSPTDVSVLAPTGSNQLTLTTCEPRRSARSRLVVTAALDGRPLDVPAPRVTMRSIAIPDRIDVPGPPAPAVVAPAADVTERPAPASTIVVVWPGLATGVVAWAIWRTTRRTRLWWLLPLGLAPVLVGLWVFFERLSSALPTEL
jgi:sortase A